MTKTKVVQLDTSPLESGHKGRGVGTYTRELKMALSAIKSDFKYKFDSKLSKPFPDLIHYPYFDLFFQTLPLLKKTKSVVTIHDVIPLKYPAKFPVGLKGQIRFQIQKLALRNVDHIITDSVASKTDIQKLLGINPQKISVVLLASSDKFKVRPKVQIDKVKAKYKLPQDYFLYVGDINYNKNLPFLIKTIGEYNKYPLVIVTRSQLKKVGEAQTDLAVVSINQALKSSQDKIIFIQIETQAELNTLYSGAMCYIQPSLAEGFGLPILEAFKSGTIVVSSKTSSLPEVGGGAAIYFDPTKSESLIKQLEKVSHLKQSERQKLIQKGFEQANSFSWQKTANQTLAIYNQVLSNH